MRLIFFLQIANLITCWALVSLRMYPSNENQFFYLYINCHISHPSSDFNDVATI